MPSYTHKIISLRQIHWPHKYRAREVIGKMRISRCTDFQRLVWIWSHSSNSNVSTMHIHTHTCTYTYTCTYLYVFDVSYVRATGVSYTTRNIESGARLETEASSLIVGAPWHTPFVVIQHGITMPIRFRR